MNKQQTPSTSPFGNAEFSHSPTTLLRNISGSLQNTLMPSSNIDASENIGSCSARTHSTSPFENTEFSVSPPLKHRLAPNINDCQNAYNKLTVFPIAQEPIRYPIPFSTNFDYVRRYKSSINDIILANSLAIIPNIDMGYHCGKHSPADLVQWIKDTKEYMNVINIYMQQKCDDQLIKFNNIENQKTETKKFNIEKINKLPEDMVNYIYEYLLPETKIELILARHPTYEKTLEKMTSANLKKYISVIHSKYYKQMYSYNSKFPNRSTCLPNIIRYLLSFSKKSDAINQIKLMIEMCRNAIPRTPEDYRYFQTIALKLLKSVIYVGYYTGNRLQKNRRALVTPNTIN